MILNDLISHFFLYSYFRRLFYVSKVLLQLKRASYTFYFFVRPFVRFFSPLPPSNVHVQMTFM